MGLKIGCQLPRILRRLEQSAEVPGPQTGTVELRPRFEQRGNVHEILCVEPGNTPERNFGLALDVGTTTVVLHLVDGMTGTTREAAAKYNSQLTFGADVISRINYAREPGGGEELQRAIARNVDTLIEDLAVRSKVGRGDIHCVVAAGNTAMLHFLLGLEADLIRLSPFIPAATSPPPVQARRRSGIRIHPRGILYSLPMVGSFVGGDVTAGILASGHARVGGVVASDQFGDQRGGGSRQPRVPRDLFRVGRAGFRRRFRSAAGCEPRWGHQ